MTDVRARFPGFRTAVLADAVVTSKYRGERHEFRSTGDAVVRILRLCAVSDAFLGQVLYRLKASLQARGVPALPRLAHRLAMMVAQISIGDPVVVQPGVYVIHGQIVVDGFVEIGPGVVIAPWVTIGLKAGNFRGASVDADV